MAFIELPWSCADAVTLCRISHRSWKFWQTETAAFSIVRWVWNISDIPIRGPAALKESPGVFVYLEEIKSVKTFSAQVSLHCSSDREKTFWIHDPHGKPTRCHALFWVTGKQRYD